MLLRTLIATKDPKQARQLAELLDSEEDVHVRALSRRDNLWEALGSGTVDLLIVDERLFAEGVLSSIEDVRSLPEAPEVVVFSENDDPAHRAELLAAEAFAVLNPSTAQEDLGAALATIVDRRTEQARQELMAQNARSGDDERAFVTESPAMRQFLDLVRKVVDTDSTLLILGETGTGKEFLARAIHAGSSRADAPFVPINCAALAESLLESELFGHVEGAFTGAQRARRGYFELAHKGTLFIDEIGELPPHLQVKLLRVIQDRQIQPVGSEDGIDIDVRILAATNRDLIADMEAGRFRADLFYRLSVVTLGLPPLRERREDIRSLVESHVAHFRVKMNRNAERVTEEAMALLESHAWPGNIRELINVIERAVLLCEGTTIDVEDLPVEIRKGESGPMAISSPRPASVEARPPGERVDPLEKPYHQARRELLDAFELHYVRAALQKTHGRVHDAARISGMNTRSLYEKMKKHGVRKEAFRF